jgi:CBS domain-containing protein
MTECPVLVPETMGVRSAAGLLDAAGLDAAPVVDSGGRCVGVFTAGDHLRWLAGGPGEKTAAAARLAAVKCPDEVRHHMTRRFAAAALDADVGELHHRMRGGAGPFVVVLDRQRRPRGIVCGLDILVNDLAAEKEGVS